VGVPRSVRPAQHPELGWQFLGSRQLLAKSGCPALWVSSGALGVPRGVFPCGVSLKNI